MMWIALNVSIALATVVLTGLLRRYALRAGLIDRPNTRSSHSSPTPRGGGLAIVVVSVVVMGLLAVFQAIDRYVCIALVGGGIAVATVGFLDDHYRLGAGTRLAVHLAAAFWAIGWLGGLPPVRVGEHMVSLGIAGNVLTALAVVWVLNLFNFMDGIDGIAASEVIFIAWAGALLVRVTGASGDAERVAWVLGAACFGFLLWNWPPAKIFMGDVGSGYVGYAIATLSLAAARQNPVAVWVWLILGGVFFVDATVTLVRRLIRGERVYEAHRSHAYQWLARRWGSHRRVTIAVLLVDVFWLLPCAVLATLHPSLATITTLIALAPLIALAMAAGSGRPEQPDRATS